MNFFQKVRSALTRWMSGRNGADNLGMFTLLAALFFSLLGSFINFPPLNLFSMVLYILTLFRMFSRNLEARSAENRKYLKITGDVLLKSKQFFRRQKNRKDYKYFKCPQCRQLLRMKRRIGEKQITCAKCGHQFLEKS